ncbi:hypothetical protein HK096_006488, partial [Nowakowskiella sp. JEL0078]
MWRNWFAVGAAMVALVGCGFDQSLSQILPNLNSFTRDIVGIDPIQLATFQAVTDFSGMIAALFMPFMYDLRGRKFAFRYGSLLGIVASYIGIAGTFIGSPRSRVAMYFCGRFFTSLGLSLAAGCSYMYASEVSHPAHRAFFGGVCGICYPIGNLLCNVVVFTMAYTPDTSWQWRIPTLISTIFPLILVCTVPFIPESPRTLIAKGRREKAAYVMKKWVLCNIAEKAYVDFQVAELDDAFKNAAPSAKIVDVYNMSPLWKTANSRRRVFYLIISNAGFLLLNWGPAAIGVFETLIFELIGLTDPKTKVGINMATSFLSIVCSYIVCSFLEAWGRRRTMLGSYSLLFIFGFIGIIAMEGFFATGSLFYVRLFVFSIFFNQVYTSPIGPAKALFESELLAYDYRAKGKALNDLTGKPANIIASFMQGYIFKKLTYHSFWVAQVYNLFLLGVFYFMMPETKGRTLEEVDEIFDHPSPYHTLFNPEDGPNFVQYSLQSLRATEKRPHSVRTIDEER